MSQTFFQHTNNIFKEKLDHPVPALLLLENKLLLTQLSETKGEKDFNPDFKKGKLGEIFVKNYLTLKGYKFIRFNDTIQYDLVMSILDNKVVKEVTFEIKVDFMAGPNTGGTKNIAIEEECRGKDSGIRKWTADYVVYIIPKENEIGFIKLEKLKTIIADFKSKNIGRIHEIGGDVGSNTVNYLMPYEEFKANWKVLAL